MVNRISIFVITGIMFVMLAVPVNAWWNGDWDRRMPLLVQENTGSDIYNYSVRFNITYDSDMQTDFDDLRFANETDDELNYWIEESFASDHAIVWVYIPTIATGTNYTLYVYYLNSSVSTTSNITDAFVFGDSFEGSAIRSDWIFDAGSVNVSDGNVEVRGATTMRSPVVINQSAEFRTRSMAIDNYDIDFGFRNESENTLARFSRGQSSTNHLNTYDGTTQRLLSLDTIGFDSTWKIYTIQWFADNITAYINGTFGEDVTTINIGVPMGARFATATNGNVTSDWVFIRSLVYPEPSYTTEAEESLSILSLCNDTYTVAYINITFINETSDLNINGRIDSSEWTYWIDDNATVNNTLTFSNTTANPSYPFCYSPEYETIDTRVPSLQYSLAGYPQRRYTLSRNLTNTTYDLALYLLSSSDGSYSVYQVQSSNGEPISDVTVTAERQIGGTWTLVESGTTDSAGAVTFWLNPDFDHRLTFTRTGYTSVQVTVRPSSSTYTVTMSISAGSATYNNSLEGIIWHYSPSRGRLIPNTIYLFGFNVTTTKGDMVGCRLRVQNRTTILNTSTGCNADGGNITLYLNTSSYNKLWGELAIDIGEGYYIIDADVAWTSIQSNISNFTIIDTFARLRNWSGWGTDAAGTDEEGRMEYSRVVLFFIILFVIFGFISMNSIVEINNPGYVLLILFSLIFMISFTGFLTIDLVVLNDGLDQFIIAILSGMITGGWWANEIANRRK